MFNCTTAMLNYFIGQKFIYSNLLEFIEYWYLKGWFKHFINCQTSVNFTHNRVYTEWCNKQKTSCM